MLEATVISLIICLCIYHVDSLRAILVKAITTALHSRSVVSVIITGLVAGKVPIISESIGGVLTVTTSINIDFITFKMDSISIPMASIGAILLGVKKNTIRQTGMATFGLAVVIGAIFGHVTFASVMKEMAWVESVGTLLNIHFVYAVVVGVMIKSWKIVIGIAVVLLAIGMLNFDTAIYIVLGTYIRMLMVSWYIGRK